MTNSLSGAFKYFLLFFSSILIISCDKDESEIIPKDEVLNNVETKFVAKFTNRKAESTDSIFISYYFQANNKNVIDTLVNQDSWESQNLKSNSGDSVNCVINIVNYSSVLSVQRTTIDLSFIAIDNNIQAYLLNNWSSGSSSGASIIIPDGGGIILKNKSYISGGYKFLKN